MQIEGYVVVAFMVEEEGRVNCSYYCSLQGRRRESSKKPCKNRTKNTEGRVRFKIDWHHKTIAS